MTTLKTNTLLVFIAFLSLNAHAQDQELLEWANNGMVTNKSYNSEVPFRYVDGYIFVDIIHNEKKYNFLFDTGAEATVINKSVLKEFEYKAVSTSTISGPIIGTGNTETIV